jgi:hypothetical protein
VDAEGDADVSKKLDKEIERLRKLERAVKELFKAAKKEGLYVGAGYTRTLPRDQQEGPMVKRIKALAEIE